jgi:hypothetical protein
VPGEVAVETRHLRKSYGAVQALRGVDLRVEAGSILGLLGLIQRRPACMSMNGISSAGITTNGRIMSWSSCSRMWQWYM